MRFLSLTPYAGVLSLHAWFWCFRCGIHTKIQCYVSLKIPQQSHRRTKNESAWALRKKQPFLNMAFFRRAFRGNKKPSKQTIERLEAGLSPLQDEKDSQSIFALHIGSLMKWQNWTREWKITRFSKIGQERIDPLERLTQARQWLVPWVPDFLIRLKNTKTGDRFTLWLEMKKEGKTKADPDQLPWLEDLGEWAESWSVIASGSDHAIAIIETYLAHVGDLKNVIVPPPQKVITPAQKRKSAKKKLAL